jgi:hypothetical protein
MFKGLITWMILITNLSLEIIDFLTIITHVTSMIIAKRPQSTTKNFVILHGLFPPQECWPIDSAFNQKDKSKLISPRKIWSTATLKTKLATEVKSMLP